MSSWRVIVVGALAFGYLMASGQALAQCAVPNVLTNGQVADASQVMENFDAVTDCSDQSVKTTGAPSIGSVAVFSGPKAVTNGNLTGDVTTSGGTATSLSSTGVTPGTYTGANIVVDSKGRITYAANGPAATGSGVWTLIYSNPAIPNPTSSIIVNVEPFNDVMVIGRAVTSSVAGFKGVQVSVDGGVNFYKVNSSYEYLPESGATGANFIGLNQNISTTAARSFGGIIYGIRVSGIPKYMQTLTADWHRFFVGSYLPITHIKIVTMASSGGADISMTGGEVYILGR